ncbi:MAG TPA: metallophosphoesterase [Candidatus Solibacter sp.]|nr:metallophosphoesterase [Candidatus Solibacter sp.]
MRVAWLTDIHLNFLSYEGRYMFYAKVKAESPDAVLIGGDIGEATSLGMLLPEIAAALKLPIYFVLGNHDFYRGSIEGVRAMVTRECKSAQSRRWLCWLPMEGVVELTPTTALVGHDGWADGRLGDFWHSRVELNDYILIRDLADLPKARLFDRLNALGDEAADYLEEQSRSAVERYRNIYVLTHVPPFREACWHEGHISDDNWLPHFACKSIGERLGAVMRDHPQSRMTILCGHTHSPGVAEIAQNLTVLTGGAQYGNPTVQRVFELM